MSSTSIKPKLSFRNDINGLRAWAVIAVLLFHFKVPGFQAGFIGVDIFFVISGFLMTGIVARGLEQQTFSLWQFYMARLRRIVPAVVMLISTLLILGWFWLPASDYHNLSSETVYSLGFLSNIYYWRSAGYFDTAAHEKWLLHTWSLGVEMQFYILFPLFALIVWKIKPSIKVFFYGLITICLASLALSIAMSSAKPEAAFYLIPTRGWELTAGGLVYLLGKKQLTTNLRRALYFIGLALWLVGSVIIDSLLPWPSGWALFPVLGTACIILAAQKNTLLMGNPIAQWLGNISYSVYLWHWPLVVALYFAGLQDSWIWIIGFFTLSLVLGELSYRLIEVPTRKKLIQLEFSKQFVSFITTIVVVSIFFLSAKLFVLEGGEEADEIAIQEQPEKLCAGRDHRSNIPVDCNFNDLRTGLISIGDSHNAAVFSTLGQVAEKHQINTLSWSKNACPLLKDAEFQYRAPGCLSFNEQIFEKLFEYPNIPVILISRLTRALIGGNEDSEKLQGRPHIYFSQQNPDGYSESYREEFKQSLIKTVCFLKNSHSVYMIRPIPEMGVHVPNALARRPVLGLDGEDVKITLKEYHERHSFVWDAQDEAAKRCGAIILDPLPYLCDDIFCYGSIDGRSLYLDDDHLNEYGSERLIPMFEQIFK